MKNQFIVFISLLVAQNLFAQDLPLKLASNTFPNKNVEISFENSLPGSYTVAIQFSDLINTDQPHETIFPVKGARGILLTLKPNDENQSIGYRYAYKYIRGKLNPKLNRDFCYILPYRSGRKVRVVEAGFANSTFFGAEKPADWKSYIFNTSQPDTVTSVRKGEVVDVIDKYDDQQLANVAYTSQRNEIIVEHEDGSLLRYSGFRKGSLFIKLGDEVLPGTILGLNAPSQNNQYSISLLLFYLHSADFESIKGQTLSNTKSLYKTITPKFSLDATTCGIIDNNKEYVAYSSEDIITRELNKKELKKYQASKKNK